MNVHCLCLAEIRAAKRLNKEKEKRKRELEHIINLPREVCMSLCALACLCVRLNTLSLALRGVCVFMLMFASCLFKLRFGACPCFDADHTLHSSSSTQIITHTHATHTHTHIHMRAGYTPHGTSSTQASPACSSE